MPNHYIIIYILLVLSTTCSAQAKKLTIKKVPQHLSKNSNTISSVNTKYQLLIESNITNYHPYEDTTGYIECRLINKSSHTILIDSLIFSEFTLSSCSYKWPLTLRRFEGNTVKDTMCSLKPNGEIVVFRTTLKNLCFSDKYQWDWIGHPAPPRSPIYGAFPDTNYYLGETCLLFAYEFDGIVATSNTLKLFIRLPNEFLLRPKND